jgi:hypothetical protein
MVTDTQEPKRVPPGATEIPPDASRVPPDATEIPPDFSEKSGDPDAPVTFLAAILGGLLVLIAVVFLQGFFHRAQTRENLTKVIAVAPEELVNLRESQTAMLEGYHWVDRREGIVRIPIEQAMDILARQKTLRDADFRLLSPANPSEKGVTP